jgi:hypothetical protein
MPTSFRLDRYRAAAASAALLLLLPAGASATPTVVPATAAIGWCGALALPVGPNRLCLLRRPLLGELDSRQAGSGGRIRGTFRPARSASHGRGSLGRHRRPWDTRRTRLHTRSSSWYLHCDSSRCRNRLVCSASGHLGEASASWFRPVGIELLTRRSRLPRHWSGARASPVG